MHSSSLWKAALVLALFVKVAEPQLNVLFAGLSDCIRNKYRPPTPKDVLFHLYTRNNTDMAEVFSLPTEEVLMPLAENELIPGRLIGESPKTSRPMEKHVAFQPLDKDHTKIKSTFFNIMVASKILIHGYNQSSQSGGMQKMKNAYLANGDYNVIIVDWSAKAKSSCYPRVTVGLPEVGRIVAKFLDLLVAGGASLASVHLIGFSLGAHVAGYTGSFTKEKLGRITGLDPASPFIRSIANHSLDESDADLVDLMHTSSDFLGKRKSMGHVDFYPNGGKKQPGCSRSPFDACSHGRAVQFFIESINSTTGFPATKCRSWPDFRRSECRESKPVLMGDPCPHGISGRYFLVTGETIPFAKLSK